MDLNIEQMKELIDLFEGSNLSEISVQQDDFQVTLKKNSVGEPKVHSGSTISQKVAEQREGSSGETSVSDREETESGGIEKTQDESKEEAAITSPIVGTFYRSPSPEEPVYVEVGDRVEKGDTVCIVEAMKVMNEVKAEQSGKIKEICVEGGDSVEYGQKLFTLSQSDKGS